MKHARAAVLVMAALVPGPATGHHSNPFYFDMGKAITLEGEVLRVEWINPHVLLFLRSQAEPRETWILQGTSLNNAMRQVGLKERLQPGISITARVLPPRTGLYLDDQQAVMPAKPGDPRQSAHIVGAGHIRFANGDVMAFGGAPTFNDTPTAK